MFHFQTPSTDGTAFDSIYYSAINSNSGSYSYWKHSSLKKFKAVNWNNTASQWEECDAIDYAILLKSSFLRPC